MSMRSMPFFNSHKLLLGLISACLASATIAGDLVVKISGINSSQGQIGCALFEKSPTFPMDGSKAKQLWTAADTNGVTCKFAGVAPGTYAVSIAHDTNGNKKVDTNFLGIPKEGWGVSNNIVPSLRAPTFDEAKFVVTDAAETVISIKAVY